MVPFQRPGMSENKASKLTVSAWVIIGKYLCPRVNSRWSISEALGAWCKDPECPSYADLKKLADDIECDYDDTWPCHIEITITKHKWR